MKQAVAYIHGKGGSAAETEHFIPFFPESDVFGFDYCSQTPWEAAEEFSSYFQSISDRYDGVWCIANSIGAYYLLCSDAEKYIRRAFFISPILNMEKLISDMLLWANVTENDLRQRKVIPTDFGEPLSWDYLNWVRENPVNWRIPTHILYAEKDHLQSLQTIRTFAEQFGAAVTVMPKGKHWFHTPEQMAFLDEWINTSI